MLTQHLSAPASLW